jgi:type IV secretion system protein VirD4
MTPPVFPRGLEQTAQEAMLATARWCDASEREALMSSGILAYAPGSFWLGRDPATYQPCGIADDRHIVTIAGSRAGKGRSGIIPNLCLYPGSVVCIDPKGENYKGTAARRGHGTSTIEGLHQQVRVLAPFHAASVPVEVRARFNPLALIDPGSEEAVETAGLIADALVMSGDAKDAHWDESARSWIEAVILLVSVHPLLAGRRDLVTVKRLIKGTLRLDPFDDRPPHEQLYDSMERMADLGLIGEVIAGAAATLREMGKEERGSVLSTVSRNLKFLDSKGIQQSLCGECDWSLDDLKTDPHGLTLYLVLPLRTMATHARWLRLMISLLVARMEAVDSPPATGHPVLAILDEANVLGHMRTIEQSAGFMAGYGLKLWTVWQDLSQLKRHYRESWETFLGNAGTLVFFGNTDLTTLEHISKRLGQTEILQTNVNETGSRSTSRRDLSALEKVARAQGRHAAESFLKSFTVESGSIGETLGETYSTARTQTKVRTPLMTADEIALWFARETGLQIVFLAGIRPLALTRTDYDRDPAFAGMVSGLQCNPQPQPQQQRSAA